MIAKVYNNNMYTFRYEIGKAGVDIDFVDVYNGTGGTIVVYGDTAERSQVLRMYKAIGVVADFEHTGFNINTTGVIEFILYEGIQSEDFVVTLYDGATRLMRFKYNYSPKKVYYDNGGGDTEIYDNPSNETSYIVRIDIDIDAGVNGQFNCYFYDSNYTVLGSVTGIEFENNATTVDEVHFLVDDVNSANGFYYLDCIGISAEGIYTQGDIQYAEVEVQDYMENTRIHDGIIPYKKIFTFDCHPKYEAYFNEGDFIDVWDVNDVFCFAGYIKTKSRDKNGIYKITCHGMANEIFERTYDKSFSSNKTSEKLQDIIDNKLEFCYRSSSIIPTTMDWSYEYDRACIYMFNLARYMERQVVYIEPDGKVCSRDYDDLVKQSEYYLGTYNFRGEVASGTDIEFVDDAVLYNGACEIVSDWQGHNKILRVTDDATPGEDPYIIHNMTQATAGTREFYVGTNDVTGYWRFHLFEMAYDYIIYLRIVDNALDYMDNGDVWQEIQAVSNDTLYHIRLVWRADNTFDVYVDGIKKVDNVATNNNMVSGINRFYIRCYGDTTKYFYLDAWGDPDNDANYNIGDNLLAGWYLYDNNQNALLIDIPGLRDSVPGYYFGNTGITSVSVRYKDNTPVIRPATPSETFKKKRLKEFRDPKLQASTEANQLGDNLYDIFSKDTIFLGMQIKGEGWLQPGKVIAIINTNQIAITAENFLIVKFVYDPKNDVHISMILSDNIITPDEFKSDLDTSSQQIHTGTLQSFENQANIAPINAYLAIGAANKRYFPCTFEGSSRVDSCIISSGTYQNVNGEDVYWTFTLPLSITRGALTLHVDGLKIGVQDADADPGAEDMVDYVQVRGIDFENITVEFFDATNRSVPGEYEYPFEVVDFASYNKVVVQVGLILTSAGQLNLSDISLRCYYA